MSQAELGATVESRVRGQTSGTPLWVRIFHFAIGLLFLALVLSGIVLTFSSSNFSMMDYNLALQIHDISGVAISIFYIIFVTYVIVSGYWRVYQRRWQTTRERMARPLARALETRPDDARVAADGERRFEASTQFLVQFQKWLYLTALFLVMPLLVGTGLPYLYPEYAPETVSGHAGLWPLALAHYIAGILGTLFIIIHIYISTIAGFRRIIFGR